MLHELSYANSPILELNICAKIFSCNGNEMAVIEKHYIERWNVKCIKSGWRDNNLENVRSWLQYYLTIHKQCPCSNILH